MCRLVQSAAERSRAQQLSTCAKSTSILNLRMVVIDSLCTKRHQKQKQKAVPVPACPLFHALMPCFEGRDIVFACQSNSTADLKCLFS